MDIRLIILQSDHSVLSITLFGEWNTEYIYRTKSFVFKINAENIEFKIVIRACIQIGHTKPRGIDTFEQVFLAVGKFFGNKCPILS